jgi:hypothetical protein
MGLLSGIQLARMRRSSDDALAEGASLTRPTYTTDSQGGLTKTYTRVWSGPVRVAPISTVVASDAVVAARLGGSRGAWITLPHHVEIRLDDRVDVNGRAYEVASYDTGRTWHISQRVLAKEIV